MNNIIEKILKKIEDIPPLSNTTTQLLNKIGDSKHSLQDIVDIVDKDVTLTGLVLKTVNSAAYGLNKEVVSVEEAIKYLGDSVIAGLAMKSEKSGIYNRDMKGYLAESDVTWSHSLKTGIAARYLAKMFASDSVQESVAYTSGIVGSGC